MSQNDCHLTAKLYVAIAKDEPSLLTLNPDEKLKQDSIIPNSTLTSLKTIIELPTKKYVDNKFIVPSIIKNTDHVDFNDKNLDIVSSMNVN